MRNVITIDVRYTHILTHSFNLIWNKNVIWLVDTSVFTLIWQSKMKLFILGLFYFFTSTQKKYKIDLWKNSKSFWEQWSKSVSVRYSSLNFDLNYVLRIRITVEADDDQVDINWSKSKFTHSWYQLSHQPHRYRP